MKCSFGIRRIVALVATVVLFLCIAPARAGAQQIAAKYPNAMDRQWSAVRQLSYYKSLISPRLPKLRSVQFEYTNEIFRELTPEEIFDRYSNDKDYRSGRKAFALYEYWHLFNMIKNTDELESICRRAIIDSKKTEGCVWPLPEDEPITQYLHAQHLCRKFGSAMDMKNSFKDTDSYESDFDVAEKYLRKCFELDPKFKKIAEADWDIFEELVKKSLAEPEPVDEFEYSL